MCVCVCVAGRFLIGFFIGAETVVLRTYVGETSSSVIAAMPVEKREKSTLKYTAFFIVFTVCALSVLSGPGEYIYIPTTLGTSLSTPLPHSPSLPYLLNLGAHAQRGLL